MLPAAQPTAVKTTAPPSLWFVFGQCRNKYYVSMYPQQLFVLILLYFAFSFLPLLSISIILLIVKRFYDFCRVAALEIVKCSVLSVGSAF